MLVPRNKHTPALSTQEVVDLLGLWGEAAMLAQLQSSHRNVDIYRQMAWEKVEKGYKREMQQGHMKIKELRQANSCSGCCACNLWVRECIHNSTSVHCFFCNCKRGLDGLSIHPERAAGPDKQEKEEDKGRHVAGGPVRFCCVRFQAWRVTLRDRMQSDSKDRKNRQVEMMVLLKEQTHMLRSLTELQAEQMCVCLPLQHTDKCIPGLPYTSPSRHIPRILEVAAELPPLHPAGQDTITVAYALTCVAHGWCLCL